jgi:hypothetical protein
MVCLVKGLMILQLEETVTVPGWVAIFVRM